MTVIVDSTCLGCAPVILVGIVSHMCGGDRIPPEQGWRCVCPEPECRRRQRGDWSGVDRPDASRTEDRPRRARPNGRKRHGATTTH